MWLEGGSKQPVVYHIGTVKETGQLLYRISVTDLGDSTISLAGHFVTHYYNAIAQFIVNCIKLFVPYAIYAAKNGIPNLLKKWNINSLSLSLSLSLSPYFFFSELLSKEELDNRYQTSKRMHHMITYNRYIYH